MTILWRPRWRFSSPWVGRRPMTSPVEMTNLLLSGEQRSTKGPLNCRSLGCAPNEQPRLGPTKSVAWASPVFFGPRTLVRTWGTRPVRGGRYRSLLPKLAAGRSAPPNEQPHLDRPRALEGLRPPFSAHVRWCEHGAPVQCAAAGTVHCSLNLPQASRLLGMTRWRVALSLLVSGMDETAGPSIAPKAMPDRNTILPFVIPTGA